MFKILLIFIPLKILAYPLSDHFDGEKFFNPSENHHKTFWDILMWKWSSKAESWPGNIPNKNYELPILNQDKKLVVTFINHATFLIQLPGLNILTDPIYSERASPLSFAGPKRSRAPGLKFEDLPKIDVVLISHNHYDHLDLDTLKNLQKKFNPSFLVPLGDEKLLKGVGIQNVREMDWWDFDATKIINIHFTPAQHWSGRGLFDKCQSLWGSFLIETPQIKIYFSGDTGYANHFKMIKEKFGAPDIALLTIGAYLPRDFMRVAHMSPEDAVMAHIDLQSKLSLGMHFGTFPMADEGAEHPVKDLEIAKIHQSVPVNHFRVLDQGESILIH